MINGLLDQPILGKSLRSKPAQVTVQNNIGKKDVPRLEILGGAH